MRERDRHNLKIGRKRRHDQRKTTTTGKSRTGATLQGRLNRDFERGLREGLTARMVGDGISDVGARSVDECEGMRGRRGEVRRRGQSEGRARVVRPGDIFAPGRTARIGGMTRGL
jgi:hypothetical protein